MSPRTGRPPKGNESRTERLNIRISKGEYRRIQRCADKMQVSKVDAIMKGIDLLQAEQEKE